MRSLLLLLLSGCTTMSDLERVEHELDRVEKYSFFEEACMEMKGYLFVYKAYRPCRRSGCIPHRVDWDFYYLKERNDRLPGSLDWRPKAGNSITCARR